MSMSTPTLNECFIEVLGELKDLMQGSGELFRAKAYQTAQESLMMYSGNITSVDQLKGLGLKGIGPTILSKLDEYVKTGKIETIERERKNPIHVLTNVYGIGPKKANELIEQGISTIQDLNLNKHLLNDVQRIGLQYYDEILSPIPREEIDEYKAILNQLVSNKKTKFEIVGSYRRCKMQSGDIDIIITNEDNNREAFDKLLDDLIERQIIIEVLSRGKTKSLTIARLNSKTPRRIDFLYSPPNEYAFAVLYFTGSKTFNMVMRQRALDMGYTLNEHGIFHMVNGIKGDKVTTQSFPDERSIFSLLNMEYKSPETRLDGRSVISSNQNAPIPANHNSEPKWATDLKSKGVSYLKTCSESNLNEMIRLSNEAYYGEGQSLLTDEQYDILIDYTSRVFPKNKVVKEGHTKTNVERNKIQLPYEMWSMDKIKPDTNALIKWRQTYKGPFVLSCKLDGVSGLYSTEGQAPKLYTRGDGMIGQDISHLIPYMTLPKIRGIVIRGEFIISKETFNAKYAASFSNSRNFIAGIINRKTLEPDILRDIDFVSYEVIKPILPALEQMIYLREIMPSNVVGFLGKVNISNELLSETLLEWREAYKYEIDGIICVDSGRIYPRTSGNPEHAFAFKMVLSNQIAEAKVVDVLWTPSKDGFLKPRVQIEPVILGGARIEYATGFNGKFIYDNKIGVGSVIKLVRSGDVIPHILSVSRPSVAPLMPSVDYVWNETHVDILLINKMDNLIVKEKNIESFFNHIGVEGFKIGKVKKVVAAGYDTIPKILNMSPKDLIMIDGFGDKSSNQIIDSINKKIGEATLVTLMVATNFARGLGEKKCGPILEAYPDILTSSISFEEKVNQLSSLKGMSDITSRRFLEAIPDFMTFLGEAELHHKLNCFSHKVNSELSNSHPLFGKKIVVTGFRDKDLVKQIESVGGEMVSSISKNTYIVLLKNLDETTGKADQARKLGIKMMRPDDFINLYFG
jgi:DNA ligase (NAD+)